MKKIIYAFLAAFVLLALSAVPSFARDLDNISGKWTRSAKAEDGQTHDWVLNITKDKFTFRVTDADKKTVLYAKGSVKLDKSGALTTVTFSDIQAGQSEDDLNKVEDDRMCVYTIDSNTLTVAMNFDKNRENGPRMDVYTRAEKQ